MAGDEKVAPTLTRDDMGMSCLLLISAYSCASREATSQWDPPRFRPPNPRKSRVEVEGVEVSQYPRYRDISISRYLRYRDTCIFRDIPISQYLSPKHPNTWGITEAGDFQNLAPQSRIQQIICFGDSLGVWMLFSESVAAPGIRWISWPRKTTTPRVTRAPELRET